MSDTASKSYLGRLSSDTERRSCWVCFGTDEDGEMPWVRPCRCKGTAKWVHVRCLQRWIDEKQRDNPTAHVSCPQCNIQYNIIYPKMGLAMKMLDFMEKCINKSCPIVAGSIFLGSVYWTAVTYGAVTVMQVLGHKEGLTVMEQADPLFLLIGLPAIPLGLIIAKLVRWEEAVLRMFRKYSANIPILGYSCMEDGQWNHMHDPVNDRHPVSQTRVLVGAMVFPTIATLVGKLAYGSVKSNFQRSLLGGISYFAVKGLLRMYYMQQNYKRRSQRTIANYTEV